jgi:hypothetical protein
MGKDPGIAGQVVCGTGPDRNHRGSVGGLGIDHHHRHGRIPQRLQTLKIAENHGVLRLLLVERCDISQRNRLIAPRFQQICDSL